MSSVQQPSVQIASEQRRWLARTLAWPRQGLAGRLTARPGLAAQSSSVEPAPPGLAGARDLLVYAYTPGPVDLELLGSGLPSGTRLLLAEPSCALGEAHRFELGLRSPTEDAPAALEAVLRACGPGSFLLSAWTRWPSSRPAPAPAAAARHPKGTTMRQPQSRRQPLARRRHTLALGAALVLSLAGCGAGLSPAATTGERVSALGAGQARSARLLSARTRPGDEPATLEARYGGRIVVWAPEDGFALLGLPDDGRLPASGDVLAVEPNLDAVAAPEVAAAGLSVWSGGISVWSGGLSVWSGGESVSEGNAAAWNQIRLPQAQEIGARLGLNARVAVIDTGLDVAHPAFEGRLAPASLWRDLVDGDKIPQDDSWPDGRAGIARGHGTAVAGTVLQVAPRANILPIRVLDADGVGDADAVALAIEHALASGARVINLSLGTAAPTAIDLMVRRAAARGVYVVSSAGNSGADLTYPARSARRPGIAGDLAVSVGSVDAADRKSSFSAFGPELELAAPGETVWAPAPDGLQAYWTGTSMAAPQAAGALALALAENPRGVERRLARLLARSADPLDDPNPELAGQLGDGRLNLEAFLRAALKR